jgi:hypothetical protein
MIQATVCISQVARVAALLINYEWYGCLGQLSIYKKIPDEFPTAASFV